MNKICVFAGTQEGRDLIEFLSDFDFNISVCVATEYGESLIDTEKVIVYAGRKDYADIVAFLMQENFDLIIDATHPYAEIVTENLYKACADCKTEYMRINRESIDSINCTEFDNIEQAVCYLQNTTGNILSTIGSKELEKFKNCNFLERFYARVLPLDTSLELCKKSNILPSHIIAMQGPFTYELNKAMINALDIKVILSKDTGKNGGFCEKIQIANDMGLELVLIKKPQQKVGYSFNQAKTLLSKRFNLAKKQEVFLVACGVGSKNLLTPQALDAIKNSQLIIGAKRLTDEMILNDKLVINEIYSYKIANIIETNKECSKISVVFTGDIGFYSGATKLYDKLHNVTVSPICGVSSPIYLCSKLRLPWQNVKLASLHGRRNNIISTIRDNEYTFVLLGGEHNVNYLCELLCKYDMGDIELSIGENLSYSNETITCNTAENLLNSTFDSLSCALIYNENPRKTLHFGINDEEFSRLEKVPMTKSEVRAVSLAKLGLFHDSISYDIGAGTGSVSVEIALNSPNGTVYSIEKNPTAICAVEKNKAKFKADNIEIVQGLAPDCIDDLPVPTHVFIGGSSGNLQSVIDAILVKNAYAKFVLNTVTLETLSEAIDIVKSFKYSEIVEISSSRAKNLGKYNLMMANNSIFVITFHN
ncbi:MAG: precorrin-6A reductase [Clostridia bacterium]